MKTKCCNCSDTFNIPGVESLSDHEGATLDCPACNAVLIIDDGILKDFHRFMNEGDPRWPADGKNTGVIEIP